MKELYLNLIEEEHEEWVEEFFAETWDAEAELKELCDLLYVTSGLAYQLGYIDIQPMPYQVSSHYDFAITEMVSEVVSGDMSRTTLGKLLYALYGYSVMRGWDLNEAVMRVHRSNMSKLTVDGNVIRRDDGKVLKSDQYKPPVLTDLVMSDDT